MSAPVGLIDNKTLLAKADLALSDLTTSGGLLQPAQAKKLIRVMIKQSVLMKEATVTPMKSPKQLVEKIRFGSRILRPGHESTPLPAGQRAKPDLFKVELDAQLFKAEVRLNNEVLEDSIERGQLRNTIMTLMAERISLDMEESMVAGDTASADPFLAVLDGILKQATSNVVAAGSVPLTKSVLRDGIKTMPSEFLRNKRALRHYTSNDAELDYRDSLSDKATSLGDKATEQEIPVFYGGVKVMPVPVMPEDLGGGSNETNVVLTDPKNINVGIWRQIRVETDKLVSEGVLLIVATLRYDVKFVHEPAVVKTTGVTVS
jgi:HK97 family phage major capsid protein